MPISNSISDTRVCMRLKSNKTTSTHLLQNCLSYFFTFTLHPEVTGGVFILNIHYKFHLQCIVAALIMLQIEGKMMKVACAEFVSLLIFLDWPSTGAKVGRYVCLLTLD